MKIHFEWFQGFVREYEARAADPGPIRLKEEHTRNVHQLGKSIAHALELPSALRRAAELAALYHDVGRFPQYVRWGTFRDADSTDHGRLGSRMLREHGVLASEDPRIARLVVCAVLLHNRKRLPGDLPWDVGVVTRIVRDADKLDIMRVMIEHFSADERDPMVTLHVAEHPTAYSGHVLEAALSGAEPDYDTLRWSNDFKILLLHWGFNLTFAASGAIMLRSGLVDELLDLLPADKKIRLLGERVRAHLLAAIAGDRSGPADAA